jgi:hypothetical protein
MGAMKRLAGVAEMGSQQTEFNLPIRLQIELFVGRNDIFCTEGVAGGWGVRAVPVRCQEMSWKAVVPIESLVPKSFSPLR